MVITGPDGGPAGSPEKDLEFTRRVLLGKQTGEDGSDETKITSSNNNDDPSLKSSGSSMSNNGNNKIAFEKETVLELTQTLIQTLPRKNSVSWFGNLYKDTFTGKEAAKLFCEKFEDVHNEEDAIKFGESLLARNIIHHVNSNSDEQYDSFEGKSDKQLYRLQPFHTPKVLNSYRVWSSETCASSDNVMDVFKRLEAMFEKLESRATDSAGKMDYVAVANDPDYPAFEESVCEIQSVSMKDMDGKTKLAFCIGMYNLMIKYAFVKVGIPSSNLQRLNFFGGVCFDIGGDIYSFNDLENGILRANSKAPIALSLPFSPSSDDPRLDLIVQNFDPRIHFALNCGAISCPPVKKYTSDDIESELQLATFEFTDNEENFSIDEEKNEIQVSMILNWFSSDFAPSKDILPESVVKFVRGEKKEKLQRMIENSKRKPIQVTFHPYDW
eukprot:CAMPEP_0197824528 /NCGR_PEP_ID=MMETSP1437-20131217/1750_1 /TAXON_ID=49252 ORGANISM="Eucampia antarctica, Strain CCMP1452" /NCGR_SAMPLE_ID=MMETSP1437 /ASSEMBLY_ACC=CAM_ASM_001096 /LENGTH=440 /DNA_ID=CAMNT_0043424183 /DNA_START=192 /DNA_END=1511 /DNA_ORIENTATION=+